jgi:shikimate kinase
MIPSKKNENSQSANNCQLSTVNCPLKVFLIGFMGSGKTVYGKPLADILQLKFFDLDSYIEEKYKLTVAEIFETKGEEIFRNYESEALREISTENSAFVLSTGGGTPCCNNNIEFINSQGISVYLKCSVDELYQNILLTTSKRPMLENKQGKDLFEHIGQLLEKRKAIYEQAKIIITSENHLPETIAEKILNYNL